MNDCKNDFDERDRGLVLSAIKLRDKGQWRLCESLYAIYRDSLCLHRGFESFGVYCEDELSIDLREGIYYVMFWQWFSRLPIEAKNFLKNIGYAKTRQLLNIVEEGNYQEIIEELGDASQVRINAVLYKYRPRPEVTGAESEIRDAVDEAINSDHLIEWLRENRALVCAFYNNDED